MKTCAICRAQIPDSEAAAVKKAKEQELGGLLTDPPLCFVCAERTAQAVCCQMLEGLGREVHELARKDGPSRLRWRRLEVAARHLAQLQQARSEEFNGSLRRLVEDTPAPTCHLGGAR